MEQRLSLVTLGVRDLSASRAFWASLGWREVAPAIEEVAFFQLPGLGLGLLQREELAKDAGVPAEGGGFSGVTLSINMRSPAEVDAVMAEAERAGARVTTAAEPVSWGGYRGYFTDIDGHVWEVAHNPGCTIHADGRTTFGGSEQDA